MSITLPDPESNPHPPRTATATGAHTDGDAHAPPPSPTPGSTAARAITKLTCYFGVYPHGLCGKEGQVTKILSSEHLDRMLAETEPVMITG